MRTLFVSMTLAAVLAAAPRAAHAQEARPFGLGLELGAPTGLSMKYYLGKNRRGTVMALQGGLGAIQRFGEDGLHLHLNVLWHPAVLTRTPDLTLAFYLGGGLRLLAHDDEEFCFIQGNRVICEDFDGDDDDIYLGARVPFGLLMDFHKVPLDLFFELALVVDFLYLDDDDDIRDEHDLVNLNGVLGMRYYF